MTHSSRNDSGLTRRDFLKLSLFSASGLLVATPAAFAVPASDSAPESALSELPFAGMTLAEVEQSLNPSHYAALSDDLKETLSNYVMYETPNTAAATTRAAIARAGGSLNENVYFTYVTPGYRQAAYGFNFTTSVACPSLYARVTITNAAGHYQEHEYSGSGSQLSCANTFYNVPAGTCSVVVTAYADVAPAGYASTPVQAIRSIAVS